MTNSPERILLVDDEPDIRKIGQLALQEVGRYTIDTAADGESALDKAREFDPDIVLLDVMMPGKDGPSVIESLKKANLFESLDVIMLTAKVQPDEIDRYQQLGAIGVIEKPFDPMTLAEQISKIERNNE